MPLSMTSSNNSGALPCTNIVTYRRPESIFLKNVFAMLPPERVASLW